MVDLKRYTVLPTSAFPAAQNTLYNDLRAVDTVDWKIAPSDGELAAEKIITSSDYDHYNHVNNTKYADFCMDAFSVDELKGKYLSNIRISYVKQCKYGEKLCFYRCLKDGFWFIEGRVGEEVRVRFKLQFSEK